MTVENKQFMREKSEVILRLLAERKKGWMEGISHLHEAKPEVTQMAQPFIPISIPRMHSK